MPTLDLEPDYEDRLVFIQSEGQYYWKMVMIINPDYWVWSVQLYSDFTFCSFDLFDIMIFLRKKKKKNAVWQNEGFKGIIRP